MLLHQIKKSTDSHSLGAITDHVLNDNMLQVCYTELHKNKLLSKKYINSIIKYTRYNNIYVFHFKKTNYAAEI